MNTLWQRFGRVARSPGSEGVAILFAEDKYFDDSKAKALHAAEARTKAQQVRATKAEKRRYAGAEAEAQKRTRSDHLLSPEPLQPITNEARVDDHLFTTQRSHHSASVISTSASLSSLENPEKPPSVYVALRSEYAQAVVGVDEVEKQGKRSNKGTLLNITQPEIDNLVNAATRPFGCYRIPINAYYRNDTRGIAILRSCCHLQNMVLMTSSLVSSFVQCAPHTPGGCPRCKVPPSSICCELCNAKLAHSSDIFARYLSPLIDEKPLRSTLHPSLLSKFAPGPVDYELRRSLDDFRCQKMQERYGPAIARNLGPIDIMSDKILERIVACAHLRKVRSVEDLQREVPKGWRIQEYGHDVIAIIQTYVFMWLLLEMIFLMSRRALPSSYYPVTSTKLFATTQLLPLQQQVLATVSTEGSTTSGHKRIFRCSVCKQVGHYSTLVLSSNKLYMAPIKLTPSPENNIACPGRTVNTRLQRSCAESESHSVGSVNK